MIIGLTGMYASGKDTVAEIFMGRSFYHYSLSDSLRAELRKRGKKVNRENLIKLGNELRETRGNSVLAEMALENVKSDKNYIISSIRNPAEVEVLQKRKDFVMVNVTAPIETRFERIRSREKSGEDDEIKTLKDLKEREEREKSADASKQQLHKVIKMAKVTINNDKDLDALNKKIDKFLQDWWPRLIQKRPSWDDYFMNIAREVARRSNCMKRHVAAVVVKDKRIISTGYNGTPRGTTNCDEGGCKRCNAYGKSGAGLGDCVCSHAEENAIVQAAFHGVSLKGATIYSTFSPCIMCTKMIINSGIKEVVYNLDYPLPSSATDLFKQAGIKMRKYEIG
jgi:dCMP deaminase